MPRWSMMAMNTGIATPLGDGRARQVDHRHHLQEGTEQQTDHTHHDQERQGSGAELDEEGDEVLRCPREGQDHRKERRHGDDGENDRCHDRRRLQSLQYPAHRQFPVDQKTDDHGPECGDGRGFGRSQQARIDAAQNDQWCHQARDRGNEGHSPLPPVGARIALHAAAGPHDIDDQQGHEDKARQDAGGKGLRHRHIGQRAEDDGPVRWWYQCLQQARSRGQHDDEALGVATLHHDRHQDRADRRDRGQDGTAEGGEEPHGQYHGDAEPPRQMSDQCHREMDQPPRHTGLQHDKSGKDEQRDREQHMLGHRAERNLQQGRERLVQFQRRHEA